MSSKTDQISKFKPASDTFEFQEFPFYWMAKLSNLYHQKMERSLKIAGMNTTSWRIGMILKEYGTLSMTDLANHAVGRLPTITKSVYKLQDQGLVEVRPNKEDARVSMVSITNEGQSTIDEVIQNTERLFNIAFDDFTEKDLRNLNFNLKKIFANLSDI